MLWRVRTSALLAIDVTMRIFHHICCFFDGYIQLIRDALLRVSPDDAATAPRSVHRPVRRSQCEARMQCFHEHWFPAYVYIRTPRSTGSASQSMEASVVRASCAALQLLRQWCPQTASKFVENEQYWARAGIRNEHISCCCGIFARYLKWALVSHWIKIQPNIPANVMSFEHPSERDLPQESRVEALHPRAPACLPARIPAPGAASFHWMQRWPTSSTNEPRVQ